MDQMTLEAARSAIAQTYESGGFWLDGGTHLLAYSPLIGALALFFVLLAAEARRFAVGCFLWAVVAALATTFGLTEWNVQFSPIPLEAQRAVRAVVAAQAHLGDEDNDEAEVVSLRKAWWARSVLEHDIGRAERKLQRLCESGIPGVSREACPNDQITLGTVRQVLASVY